jgi:hypothetical protein
MPLRFFLVLAHPCAPPPRYVPYPPSGICRYSHWIVWIAGVVQTAFYCDFFYYYVKRSVCSDSSLLRCVRCKGAGSARVEMFHVVLSCGASASSRARRPSCRPACKEPSLRSRRLLHTPPPTPHRTAHCVDNPPAIQVYVFPFLHPSADVVWV